MRNGFRLVSIIISIVAMLVSCGQKEEKEGPTVTTFAGTAGSYGSTNGTGSDARFNNPLGITWDKNESNLYVSDTSNNTIRKIHWD